MDATIANGAIADVVHPLVMDATIDDGAIEDGAIADVTDPPVVVTAAGAISTATLATFATGQVFVSFDSLYVIKVLRGFVKKTTSTARTERAQNKRETFEAAASSEK